jgi:general secretion pathway protein G
LVIIALFFVQAARFYHGRSDAMRRLHVATDLQRIKMNLLMYQAKNGFYPSTEQGLKALVEKPATDPKPRNWSQLDNRVPRDPWGQEYFYRYPGKHNPKEYDLWSAGPDRNPDTEQDNISL